MKISKHAADQMTRRGIGTPNILAVLFHGVKESTKDPWVVRHTLEGLVVVMDCQRNVVVTTFHQYDKRPGVQVRSRSTGMST
jgi:hypothetical protein